VTETRYFLSGEIDLASAPRVRADLTYLIDLDGGHLLIDCSELTFIDSCGVAALLEAHSNLERNGRHIFLVNVQPGPGRVFDALGLSDLFRDERHSKATPRAKATPNLIRRGSLRLIYQDCD